MAPAAGCRLGRAVTQGRKVCEAVWGTPGGLCMEVAMDQKNHGNMTGATAPESRFTAEAFAMLGAPDLAYVRPVQTQMGQAFGIFAANGQHVGLAETAEHAFSAARQHDLAPVYVH